MLKPEVIGIKLVPYRSNYEFRRHYFSHRIVICVEYRIFPDSVTYTVVGLSAGSVNSFKLRLDRPKFWSMHNFVYDYGASPLAAGS